MIGAKLIPIPVYETTVPPNALFGDPNVIISG